jgi:hypothetical protein
MKLKDVMPVPQSGVKHNRSGRKNGPPGLYFEQYDRPDLGGEETSVTYTDPEGVMTTVNRSPTLSHFKAASAPLATGAQWAGTKYAEHEFMRGSRRMVRISGREFLGTISASYSGEGSVYEGARLAAYPIAPESMGGRLELYSEMYEQHRAIKFDLIYVPVVPATTNGAIIMYYRNDPGIQTLTVGIQEIKHASTLEDFIEFPVWEHARLSVKPTNTQVKYWNEVKQNFRQSTQGIVQVEAGSELSAQSYGNLFLEYDFEFYSPALDYEIQDLESYQMSINTSASTATVAGAPVALLFDSAHQADSLATLGVIGGSYAPADGDLLYFTIQAANTPYVSIAWQTSTDNTSRSFTVGQTIWCRFRDNQSEDPNLECLLFGDLASASDISFSLNESDETINDGQLFWTEDSSAGSYGVTTAMYVTARVWRTGRG